MVSQQRLGTKKVYISLYDIYTNLCTISWLNIRDEQRFMLLKVYNSFFTTRFLTFLFFDAEIIPPKAICNALQSVLL